MARQYHSPSSINTYLRCPRKYYLKYVRGLKEKPSIHLFRGSAVHQALAKLTTNCSAEATYEEVRGTLLGFFEQAWGARSIEIGNLGLSQEEVQTFYQETIQMLSDWARRYARARQKGLSPPRTEIKLFSSRYGVMGIIDAIYDHQGRIYLLDYKTSKSDEVTRDIQVQMSIYALLYLDKFHKMPHTVSIDFLKPGTIKRLKVTEETLRYAQDLIREIHQKTQSEEESDYPCTCGGWCDRDFNLQNGGC